MKNLLQINSSIFGAEGQSTQLANRFVSAYRQRKPQLEVTVRDFSVQPLAHLDGKRVMAFSTPAENRSPEQQTLAAESDQLIAELKQADLIVLAVPMYNFGIPSTLKAYFDYIARSGITFKYTENGPVGLLTGKKVLIFTSRGGKYAGTAADTETQYLKDYLSFLGLSDIEFIYAEGLNMGDEVKQAALADAAMQIDVLVAKLP
jgi:FMN-dependent NADH-azoreductase